MKGRSRLDLRIEGSLGRADAAELQSIALALRHELNVIIEHISQENNNQVLWWALPISSRNTQGNDFLFTISTIRLLQEKILRGDLIPDIITVNKKSVKSIVQNLLVTNNITGVRVLMNPLVYGLRRVKSSTLAAVIHGLYRLAHKPFASLYAGTNEDITEKNTVLVDSFILPGYEESNRWYGDMLDYFCGIPGLCIAIVPTVVNTSLKQIPAIYRNMSLSKRDYVYKDVYLRISDYFFAAFYPLFLKKLHIPDVTFHGINIRPLVIESIYSSRDVPSTIECLLTFSFLKRIKQRGVCLTGAIDWFEGHSIDHVWNIGLSQFFRGVKRHGYRAYESPPLSLCSFPTDHEVENHAVPDVVMVQGNASTKTLHCFSNRFESLVIPSFKSKHVWETKMNPISQETVLVTLPISEKRSTAIVYDIIEASKRMGSEVRFIVKTHPASNIEKIDNLNHIPADLSISVVKSGHYQELIKHSRILVSEASSTILEAMALGVPVLLLMNRTGLTYDPTPEQIPGIILRRVYDINGITEGILHYSTLNVSLRQKIHEASTRIRAEYFCPVQKTFVDRLVKSVIGC